MAAFYLIRAFLILHNGHHWENTMTVVKTYWLILADSWGILGNTILLPRRPQASGEEEWYFPLSLRTKTVFPNMSLPEPQSLSMMATVQDQYCSYWIECRHSIGRDMAWHELPPLMVGLKVGKFCEREQNYFQLPLYSPMVKLQHEFWPFRWIQKHTDWFSIKTSNNPKMTILEFKVLAWKFIPSEAKI